MSRKMLSDSERDLFQTQGFLKLEGFYDVDTEIVPILKAIHAIIGILLKRESLPPQTRPFSMETFDDGILTLVQHNRQLGGVVYDAVKQIPAFVRLLSSEKHERLMAELRQSRCVGIAAGGAGIRLDLPFEEKYRAPWHQDYPNQLRSLDGLVFWSPLRTVFEDLGPALFCAGSHREGPLRVRLQDPEHPEKTGAYAMRLENEAAIVARYPVHAPLSAVGDLILIDFLTVHASGLNRSPLPRWSMQMRYFNFNDPTGIHINWSGSFAAAQELSQIVPELVRHD